MAGMTRPPPDGLRARRVFRASFAGRNAYCPLPYRGRDKRRRYAACAQHAFDDASAAAEGESAYGALAWASADNSM